MSIFRVFRSRWHALFWAGGVLWFAYDVASAQPQTDPASNRTADAAVTDVTGAAVNQDDVAGLLNQL